MSGRIATFPLPAAASDADACEAAALQLISDILLFHAAVTIPLGGRPSLTSPHLLDSAAHRPFFMYGGEFMYHDGLEQAAALFGSLAQNHAFEDGNKRTALTSCLFFLERCGYWQHIAVLSTKESAALEALTLVVATRRTPDNVEVDLSVADIAQALDHILGPSRHRRLRPSRLLSGAFRRITDLFLP